MNFDDIKKKLEAMYPDVEKVVLNILSMALYAGFYTLVNTYLTNDWQVNLALTAGFRAFTKVIIDQMPKPKVTMGKVEGFAPVRKYSDLLA